jgi:hypothetical protein
MLVTPCGIFPGPEEVGAFFAQLIENNPGLTQTVNEPTVVMNTGVSTCSRRFLSTNDRPTMPEQRDEAMHSSVFLSCYLV